MLSPRHRFNKVAPSIRQPTIIDGLEMRAVPDALTKEMLLSLAPPGTRPKPKKGDPKPNKLIQRAFNVFVQSSMRYYYDAMLFVTLDAGRAAEILNEDPVLMQIYADCFFDISVFESPSWRLSYLEAVYRRDPVYADALRNMLTMDEATLLGVSDRSKIAHIDPKTALETCMRTHFMLSQAFNQMRLETLVSADIESSEFKRFEKLYHMSVTSTTMVHKLAETILRYDLDKSKQNFMDEFAMNLRKAAIGEFIANPETMAVEDIS